MCVCVCVCVCEIIFAINSISLVQFSRRVLLFLLYKLFKFYFVYTGNTQEKLQKLLEDTDMEFL